jgi:hypothetical protein
MKSAHSGPSSSIEDILSPSLVLAPLVLEEIQKLDTHSCRELLGILERAERALVQRHVPFADRVHAVLESFRSTWRFGPRWIFISMRIQEIQEHGSQAIHPISHILGVIYETAYTRVHLSTSPKVFHKI